MTSSERQCSRVTCSAAAEATLTYVYADSMAVLGPLSGTAEPYGYDLCPDHAERLRVPQGWSIIRLAEPERLPPPGPRRRGRGTLHGL